VSRIAGHVDAVEDGVSGLVVDLAGDGDGTASAARSAHTAPAARFAHALRAVLCDGALAARLGRGALRRARELTWESTAAGTLDVLVDEVAARTGRGREAWCSPSG